MEKIVELLKRIEEDNKARCVSSEERAKEIAEIDECIRQISIALRDLFNRKAELVAEEEEYQRKQEIFEQEYSVLNELYSKK
jgi:hypothetical protein